MSKEQRLVIRSDLLRQRVIGEQARLRDEEGLNLSMGQTAARLIHLGLEKARGGKH